MRDRLPTTVRFLRHLLALDIEPAPRARARPEQLPSDLPTESSAGTPRRVVLPAAAALALSAGLVLTVTTCDGGAALVFTIAGGALVGAAIGFGSRLRTLVAVLAGVAATVVVGWLNLALWFEHCLELDIGF